MVTDPSPAGKPNADSSAFNAMHLFDLTGKVAIVTGASGGLGEYFSYALAANGAHVVMAGRRAPELDRVRSAIEAAGGSATSVPGDVRRATLDDAVLEAASARGGVDILVNNAGVTYVTRAEKDSAERFSELVDLNLTSAYRLATACARHMIAANKAGSIINITSLYGLIPVGIPAAAYSASKAGLTGLTRELASQWSRRYGIRVNAIAPGFFLTDMTSALEEDERGRALVSARAALGRFGHPRELVGALLLLASDAGGYMTGVTVTVDGGWAFH